MDPDGRTISGYDDLPNMPPSTSRTTHYPALAWFYHTEYRGQAIRVAKLLQPVNEDSVFGMAEIYVAETLQSRRYLATQLLFSPLVSQAAGAADAGPDRVAAASRAAPDAAAPRP